ncbi:transcriptional regulator [Solihabitans fulvus]|uniref:Transcriptional regulator n=1 Tax=Solihabitans fulvus TaxID=1892852 RepID=A0A5B2X099_9PSEU|nr:SRPBCC family protein [Solihabitans fulvus]KAA2256326.1 transcriptional regulator [Solihabitans fulvus]
MTASKEITATVHVSRVFIRATPEAVWKAITDPEWNGKYGYHFRADYDLRPGGDYRVHANDEARTAGAPEVMIDGEIIESDPPTKLVQTWRAHFTEETLAEGFTRLTWELEPEGDLTRLTVTHELPDASGLAVYVSGNAPEGAGGGWPFILSDLKTLLETGKSFAN